MKGGPRALGILPAHGYLNGEWTGEEYGGLREDNLAIRIGRELSRLTGGELLRWTPDALCSASVTARRAAVVRLVDIHVHAAAREGVLFIGDAAYCSFPDDTDHVAEWCRALAREIAQRLDE